MRNCQIVSHYMMELELEFVVLHLLSSCFIFSVCGVWRFWVRAIMETLNGFNMSLRNDETKSKSFIRKMFSSKERNRTRGIKNSPESVSNLDTETPMVQNIKTLRVFMATWNVGGKCPPSNLTLDDFLQVHESSDIYVLGFQEIVPLNAGNVLVEDNEPSAKWLALVNRSLNGSYNIQPLQKTTSLDSNHVPTKGCKLTTTSSGSLFFQKYSLKAVSKQFRTESKKKLKSCNCISELERKYSRDSCFRCQPGNVSEDDMSSEEEDGLDVTDSTGSSQLKYGLIVCKQMVGIFLTIWVKKELVPYVSHLRSCYITRGIMGCLGNKGCISVSMSLYQTSFCFICSHLASGEKEGDELRRNLDVIEILKNTQFPKRCRIPNTRIPDRILEHDRIIWLGDLNYRIALSHGETIKLVQKNEWDILLSKDQLKIEREAGRVFKGWKEGRIYFAPTYKYSYNSNTYIGEINNSPNKRRTPAWCDRILWHGNGIRQLSYVRKDSKKYQFSDHRPVCATFLVDVPVTEAGSRKGIPSSNMKVEIEELLPASSMW